MLRQALIVIGLSVSVPAEAQLPSPPPEVAPQVVKEDRYPAHNATFPNGVRGVPGAVYWEPVGYRPLTLDLYLPPSSIERPATGFPVVMYIHGGGWMGGDPHRSEPFVDFLSIKH